MQRHLTLCIAALLACTSCRVHPFASEQRSRPVLTLSADTRGALTASLRALIDALPRDSVTVCITLHGPAPDYWYSPEPQMLAELRTPAHPVVGPLRCPRTYDQMVTVVDSTGRSLAPVRPPGYIDPHDVKVETLQLSGGDSASIAAVASQGSWNRSYVCIAHRDARLVWLARCELRGTSISAVPANVMVSSSRPHATPG